ncbi:MAG: methyltransferase [Gammaproteobacteria bacterium]
MLEDARAIAPLVAPFILVRSGARRLIDTGGSHGLYSALLLREEVFELTDAIGLSRDIAVEQGYAELVSHRALDVLTQSWDAEVDVTLLNNVVHHFTSADCASILQRLRATMVPDATIAILEWTAPASADPPNLVRGALALCFRTHSRGLCHDTAEYSRWLAEAGFVGIRVRRPIMAPHRLLVTARVPRSDQAGAAFPAGS